MADSAKTTGLAVIGRLKITAARLGDPGPSGELDHRDLGDAQATDRQHAVGGDLDLAVERNIDRPVLGVENIVAGRCSQPAQGRAGQMAVARVESARGGLDDKKPRARQSHIERRLGQDSAPC